MVLGRILSPLGEGLGRQALAFRAGFLHRGTARGPRAPGRGARGGVGGVHPTKHTALCFEKRLYPQALGLESEAPSPSALPPPRCQLLRGFHVEASLSKFTKCLFTPVRWGLGEAVNAKMAPARGLKGTFWGHQMELQPLTPGGLRLRESGPTRPLRAPRRCRSQAPAYYSRCWGPIQRLTCPAIHQDDSNEPLQSAAMGLVNRDRRDGG